jgi:CRP/FNR family cyclic AMP-dependent transcriptional regulator
MSAMPDSAKYQVDSRSLLLAIGEGITRINWRSDATVYSQGDEADALFYIQAGRLKITAVSTFGKEAVVAILGTGDFFGEGCLAGQPLRLSSAKTLVKSSIWRLDKAALVRALRTQLANFGKEGQPLPIIAPISQKILAEMIGTTRR